MKNLWLVCVYVCIGCKQTTIQTTDPILVSIGEQSIHSSVFKTYLMRMQLDSNAIQEMEITQKKLLLDDFINHRLLFYAAEKSHLSMTGTQVEGAYQDLQRHWHKLAFDAYLQDNHITSTELKSELYAMLLVKKYLRDHVFVRIAVVDEEIDNVIKNNPDIRHIEDAIRLRHIHVKSDEVARQVLHEIKHGLAFEDAAVQYSMSKDAALGGDMGFVTRKNLPADFANVCFNLKIGQISQIISSPYGYHMFKVTDAHKKTQRSLQETRDHVEKQLLSERESNAILAKLRDLRTTIRVDVKEDVLEHLL